MTYKQELLDQAMERFLAAMLDDEANRNPDRWDYLGDPDELVRHRGALSGLRVA